MAPLLLWEEIYLQKFHDVFSKTFNFIIVVSEFSFCRQGSFPAPVFDAAADGMAYQNAQSICTKR